MNVYIVCRNCNFRKICIDCKKDYRYKGHYSNICLHCYWVEKYKKKNENRLLKFMSKQIKKDIKKIEQAKEDDVLAL